MPISIGSFSTRCCWARFRTEIGRRCSATPGRSGATDELRQVRQPIDFVGVNYYLRLVVRDDPTAGPARARAVPQPNCPHTAMGWEIYPQGLTDTLHWVQGPLRQFAAVYHGKRRRVRR